MRRYALFVVIGLLGGGALLGLYVALTRMGPRDAAGPESLPPEMAHAARGEPGAARGGAPDGPPGAAGAPRGAGRPAGARGVESGGSVAPVPVPVPPRPPAPPEDFSPPPGVAPAAGSPPSRMEGEPSAEPPAVPPGLHQPDRPPTMLAQVNRFVEESKRTAGPQAAELGAQLLTSTNPLLRVAGVAVLAENDALDEATLQYVAEDEDPAVAVNALGWLLDHGQSTASGALGELLAQRSLDSTELVRLIDSGQLIASGSRAALEVLSDQVTGDEARVLFGSISEDDTHDYAVRMKATLLMREQLEFATFRNEVKRLQGEASGEDPLWAEGITRLADRIAGPVAVHSGAPTLTANDVDEMLAREYPMTLEDLAQHLEYVTGQEDAYVAPGTSDRLREHIAELQKLPWTENQQVSLTRLETLAEQLPAFEETSSGPPPNMLEPPPGAE